MDIVSGPPEPIDKLKEGVTQVTIFVNKLLKFHIGQEVVYEGKTYTFPGTICGVTTDGQYIVEAHGDLAGFYKGMKHIFGESQLYDAREWFGNESRKEDSSC